MAPDPRPRKEAAVVIEGWRRHYNTVRAHSSLNYLTLHEFRQHNHLIPNRVVLTGMNGSKKPSRSRMRRACKLVAIHLTGALHMLRTTASPST